MFANLSAGIRVALTNELNGGTAYAGS